MHLGCFSCASIILSSLLKNVAIILTGLSHPSSLLLLGLRDWLRWSHKLGTQQGPTEVGLTVYIYI